MPRDPGRRAVCSIVCGCVVLSACGPQLPSRPQQDLRAAYSEQGRFYQQAIGLPDLVVMPAFLQNETIGEVRQHGASIPSFFCKISASTNTGSLQNSGPAEWTYSIAVTATGSARIQAAAVQLGIDFHNTGDMSLSIQKPQLSYVAAGNYPALVASLVGSNNCSPDITAVAAGKQYDMIVGIIRGSETWLWNANSGGGIAASA